MKKEIVEITPWRSEERIYDSEGKLVEVRTILSSRTINKKSTGPKHSSGGEYNK